MRYAYHFEFCERAELPEWLRADLFGSLAWVQKSVGLAGILRRDIPKILEKTNSKRLIELGCGSGDGLSTIASALRESQMPVIATDKFPNVEMWKARLSQFSLARWYDRSVSFEDFDQKISKQDLTESAVLLTAAFHHMTPESARGFLERAAGAGVQVIVVEPLSRSLWGAVLGGLAFLPALLAPVVLKNLSFARRLRIAAFHWVLPIIPVLIGHDGVVSSFRQRQTPDWEKLIVGLPFKLEIRENLGFFRNFSVVVFKY